MRILSLLVSAGVLSGTTALLRTGTGSGQITNCTNATPIVCTVTAHGLTDNDRVVIENVLGNTNANGAFYVDVLTTSTFALYSASGPATPVAGNGAYVAGSNMQLMGKVAQYTLADHPRVFMKGPSDIRTLRYRCWTTPACLTNITVNSVTDVATANITGYNPSLSLAPGKTFGVWRSGTASLNGPKTVVSVTSTTITWTDTTTATGTYTDASISEYAWGGNPSWDLTVSGDDAFALTYNTPHGGQPGLENYKNAALRWWITGNSASLTRTMYIIDHPEGIAGSTLSCNEASDQCGGRPQLDYGRSALAHVAVVYTLIRDQLSGAQITALANKLFNDKDLGGCTAYTSRTTGPGTVSFSGTTLTGAGGTTFNSYAVGGAIHTDWDGAGGGNWTATSEPRVITAIASDTSMTVGVGGGASSGQTYQYSPPWSAGECGVIALLKHHSGGTFGDPTTYPTNGGHYEAQEGTGFGQYLNLAETGLVGYLNIGIALADDDARARRLLQAASVYMHDWTLAYDMKTFTGMGHLGGGYGLYRGGMPAQTCMGFNWSFIGYTDLGCSNWESWLASMIYSYTGISTSVGTGVHARLGLGGAAVDGGYFLSETSAIALTASPTWQGYWRQWLNNSSTWNTGALSTNQSKAAGWWLMGIDPQVTPIDYAAVLPLAKVFNTTQYALCNSLGMTKCLVGTNNSTHRYDHYMSRSTWSNPATLVILYGGTTEPDHFGTEHAGNLVVTYGNKAFIGGFQNDGSSGGVVDMSYSSSPYLVSGYRAGEANTNRPIANITRSYTATGVGYAMTDYTGAWNTATGAHRHMVHIGQFFATYDWATGVPAGSNINTNYHQNSEAGEGNTTLTAGKVTSQSPADSLMGSWSTPGGATAMRVALSNPYPVFRMVKACPSSDGGATCNSATSFEFINSHRMVSGLGDTALTQTEYNPDANWTGVQLVGTGNGAVMMFSRGGLATRTTVPAVTTTVTAPYIAVGMAPGTYSVLLGGVGVVGCTGLTVTTSDNVVFCPSVNAGAISVGAGSTAGTSGGSRVGGSGRAGGGGRVN